MVQALTRLPPVTTAATFRRMGRAKLLHGAVAVALAGCSPRAPQEATAHETCPTTIAVRQAVEGVPGGWESSQSDIAPQLVSVSVFDGHPSGKADLVPTAMTEAGGHRVSSWTLFDNGKRHFWLSCSYSRTNIVLARAIASSVSAAEVTYDLGVTLAGQPAVLKIVLR